MWHIEVMDHCTLSWRRLAPSVDGVARQFRTKRAAEDYAYDYGYTGGRNAYVRYVNDRQQ